ncbi:DUF2252 domain-containing protein [Spirosoma sp. HMF4905]|uniref:DUF2252 domain-containing protein n=1 Tax=Spirosoma arboris TaxID=2682092 RepID=A0A7K1SNF8_9BACT|nr:DUF2252 family protein [Spirosoma arboris]MVM35311.1 DUF2252 domain-containing protein [Spirosoma arboris]
MNQGDLLLERIQKANQDRREDMLMRKYKAMSESAFRFFRATPSLFYQDAPRILFSPDYPTCWVCADLHLENIGSYRGENKLVYFDINDFDEALLAPCTVDIARLVTSLFVAAPLLKHSPETSRQLASQFISAYNQMLLRSKPRSIERQTATGILKEFLDQATEHTRKGLIARLTRGSGLKRHLHTNEKRLLALKGNEREDVWNWLQNALQNQGDYQLRDVAFRIAGTSSIGLNRYAALVESPNRRLHLLDIKATRPSAAEPYVGINQPHWPDQATRIVTLQNRLQDVPPAKLWTLAGPDEEYYVVRYLQPQADRMNLAAKHVRGTQRLGQLLETMAQLTASAHLRSGGRQGSATADELIAFANNPYWTSELLAWAETYAQQVQQDHAQFKSALKAGWPKLTESH